MSSDTVINVTNLVKYYGKTCALQGISFRVSKGEVFGFLGPNGVGKTTTIRILTGLTTPTSGSCQVLGFDVPQDAKRMHPRLGVVFEESNLYPNLSGEQNLSFFAALFGVDKQRVRQLLTAYGLEKAARKPVNTYSKGMKQRLLICRALLNEPQLLILDEPTSGLDVASTEQIRTSIRQFREHGQTVFLSTHSMEEAEELCDRVAFINNGRILLIDTPSHLRHLFGEPVVMIDCQVDNEGKINELKQALGDQNISTLQDSITISVALNDPRLGWKLDKIREYAKIRAIHSKEASLKQVFQQVIG